MQFEEMEASREYGITFDQYIELPGSPMWREEGGICKCDVLMWHRYHKLLPLVQDDMAYKRMKMRR